METDDLRRLSVDLAKQVKEAPDFLIALWRGGATIGCYVHEYLMEHFKVSVDHFPVRTSRYSEIKAGEATERVKVIGLEYIFKRLRPNKNRILIVDDVWDAGTTMAAVLEKLSGLNARIEVGVIYWKPQNSKVPRGPDYWVEKTSAWIVLPHEYAGRPKEDTERIMAGSSALPPRE